MTPHTHRSFVPGCYRCDLSRVEMNDQTPLPSCRTCDGEGVVTVWSGEALATCDTCDGTGEAS